MKRMRTEGDNFNIETSPGKEVSESLITGVVSGETGDTTEGSPEQREAALNEIKAEYGGDPVIAALFAHINEPDPRLKIEALLDELDKIRRTHGVSAEREAHLTEIIDRLSKALI